MTEDPPSRFPERPGIPRSDARCPSVKDGLRCGRRRGHPGKHCRVKNGRANVWGS